MVKYISMWFVLIVITGFSLLSTASLISAVSFVNIFSEFEILLMLAGFSSILSTLVVCTKLISDKIDAYKRVETIYSQDTDPDE